MRTVCVYARAGAIARSLVRVCQKLYWQLCAGQSSDSDPGTSLDPGAGPSLSASLGSMRDPGRDYPGNMGQGVAQGGAGRGQGAQGNRRANSILAVSLSLSSMSHHPLSSAL